MYALLVFLCFQKYQTAKKTNTKTKREEITNIVHPIANAATLASFEESGRLMDGLLYGQYPGERGVLGMFLVGDANRQRWRARRSLAASRSFVS